MSEKATATLSDEEDVEAIETIMEQEGIDSRAEAVRKAIRYMADVKYN